VITNNIFFQVFNHSVFTCLFFIVLLYPNCLLNSIVNIEPAFFYRTGNFSFVPLAYRTRATVTDSKQKPCKCLTNGYEQPTFGNTCQLLFIIHTVPTKRTYIQRAYMYIVLFRGLQSNTFFGLSSLLQKESSTRGKKHTNINRLYIIVNAVCNHYFECF
jgi:hypothetical protein